MGDLGVILDLYAAFAWVEAGGFPYAQLVGPWGGFVEELGGMLGSGGRAAGAHRATGVNVQMGPVPGYSVAFRAALV